MPRALAVELRTAFKRFGLQIPEDELVQMYADADADGGSGIDVFEFEDMIFALVEKKCGVKLRGEAADPKAAKPSSLSHQDGLNPAVVPHEGLERSAPLDVAGSAREGEDVEDEDEFEAWPDEADAYEVQPAQEEMVKGTAQDLMEMQPEERKRMSQKQRKEWLRVKEEADPYEPQG